MKFKLFNSYRVYLCLLAFSFMCTTHLGQASYSDGLKQKSLIMSKKSYRYYIKKQRKRAMRQSAYRSRVSYKMHFSGNDSERYQAIRKAKRLNRRLRKRMKKTPRSNKKYKVLKSKRNLVYKHIKALNSYRGNGLYVFPYSWLGSSYSFSNGARYESPDQRIRFVTGGSNSIDMSNVLIGGF